MKGIAILAATAAALTLTGCNRNATTANSGNASANTASANSSAPKPGEAGNGAAAQSADAGKLNAGGGAVPASSSGTAQLDRTYMLGRWTDDNDCNNVIEFTQDGRFIAANGGTGLWNLEGDQLTMTGRDTATIRVRPIDQNTMTVINTDGSLGRSTRC
ncbi:MAG: hypothetical protein JO276_00970 [Sphingomonadaceae bacterium]|nr:hypothetical protein [Sphingomonadaceae bacterium]